MDDPELTPSQWIAKCAARLGARWRTAATAHFEAAAVEVWRDPTLRELTPEDRKTPPPRGLRRFAAPATRKRSVVQRREEAREMLVQLLGALARSFPMSKLARLGLVSVFIAIAPAFAWADIEGMVVRISDGDTLTVLDAERVQHKVRLAGIDAPEKGQPFGNRSKQSLAACAFGRNVSVVGHKLDRYGRLVGEVVVDGADCNLLQVQRGLAWHYKQYQREQPAQDRDAYSHAEEDAREHRAGLWMDPAPLPPWEYRRERP